VRYVTPERLRDVERLFHQARERPPEQRGAFLTAACGNDSALRREVESLLAQPPAGAIDMPIGALVADLVAPRLAPGAFVGPYRIERLLGVGGMGEVYRARDTRLDRDVAIKTLPDAFAADAERVARFAREAKLLGSLNHPSIAAIYGLEDVAGTKAIVMELVEGEDLAHRLSRGAVPLDEALPIAKQIADALEAAHEQGVVHRDLKPANIKVRADDTVKVLDFGLAKAFDATGSSPGVTRSPMISTHATRPGVILGTAAYMPPEQAKGKPVDKRADLWSFGCVLFEMLAGRRPFEGETISDVLARIIERDPDWSVLPAKTPAPIKTLLRRCLEKDPRRRLDSAGVARLEIEEAVSNPTAIAHSERGATRDRRSVLRVIVPIAALAALVGAITTWALVRPAKTPPAAVSRFAITLPAAQALAFSINDRDIALSADGTRLAYVAGDQAQLMVRSLDRLDAVPVAGVTGARAPFLSPDGRWIGFFERIDEGTTTGPVVSRGVLKKVSTNGGPPVVICGFAGTSRGASWGSDDSIVFATNDRSTGLLRVPASGGEPEVLTRPDTASGERDHFFPSVLPGARGLLFTVYRGAGSGRAPAAGQIAVLDLKTGSRKTVIRSGSQAGYVDTGYLVYSDGGSLWAVRFDLATLSAVGDPVPLLEQVLTLGAADFTFSRNGTLIYVPVRGSETRSLVWVSRQGAEEPIAAPPREYVVARLSPDGTRAALQIRDPKTEIWTWDFSREKLTRVTFAPGDGVGNSFPVWTPDGRFVIYGSPRESPAPALITHPYRRRADGTGTEDRLARTANPVRPVAISPDGRRLVLEEMTPSAGYDFTILYLDGSARTEPLLQTPFDERNAAISPDGHWLAYESNESGQSQIYVRSFPNVADARYQVSTDGGRTPVWAPNGTELFFVNRSSIMAAPIQAAPAFSIGNPAKLFDAPTLLLDGRFIAASNTNRNYDVSRDGQRFLMIKTAAAPSDGSASLGSMVVVQNWFAEVTAKMAAAK
jgi:Tol biopolymer transport system component